MKSMTGYAAVHKTGKSFSVQIVMRSFNFKYLDINVRNLSAEDILLEEGIKRQIKKRVSRGKIEVFIFLEEQKKKKVLIDEETVAKYISQAKSLAKKYKLKADITISDILNLPQAISWEQKRKGHQAFVLGILAKTLDSFIAFRKKEGAAIQREMLFNLGNLKNNILKIKKAKPSVSVMENGKEDIDEELSLISFYIKKVNATIKAAQLITKGKSIDFLTQEILRELNAASSKTKRKASALLIVEAKNYLERIREQTQNIE